METTRRDWSVAIIVSLAAFLVYLRTLAPTVLPGDSGEFQFAAPLLSLAHPTGYPLYLILGKLWTLLVPLGDMAFRMNLLSATLSAAAVGGLYLLSRRIGLAVVPAALAALMLALSRTFWSQAVRAEVYALNSLFTVALIHLAVGGSGRGDAQTARSGLWRYVLPFVFGLSLTHHRMTLLLIPALLLLIFSRRQSGFQIASAGSWMPFLIALVLPLLLYAYIPLRAEATPYRVLPVGGGPDLVLYENTVTNFAAMVTGSVFRGSLVVPGGVHLPQRLRFIAELMLHDMLAGLFLAVLGVIILAGRKPRLALALLVTFVCVAGFCLVYAIGDIADLLTPAYIVAALLAGVPLDAMMRLRGRSWLRWGPLTVLAVGCVVLLSLLCCNLPVNNLSGRTDTRAYWEALLVQPLPTGSILVSNDRDEMTPMWYMQYVEGKRRDLVGLFLKIKPGDEFSSLGALLDWLLTRGQQPYLIKPMPGLDIKYRVETADGLPRVLGWAASAPLLPERLVHANLGGEIELIGADVQGMFVAGSTLTVTLYWMPFTHIREDYHVFVQVQTPAGERVVGSDHRPGDVFYPTSQWRPGDILVDRHVFTLPASLAVGTYHLRVGMYRYPAMTRLPVNGGQEAADAGAIEIGGRR